MTVMTKEQIEALHPVAAEAAGKLLDGTTPGPWRKRDCDVVVGEGLTAKTICHFWRHWSNDEKGIEQTEPNAALTAAAPDLARTVIALHAQLADAKAAQAMVRHVDDMNDLVLMGLARDEAIADRDRLAAANAALEAQVARLVGALERLGSAEGMVSWGMITDNSEGRELKARMKFADAALAEVQADARREGGE